jgi:hypothetical protein
MAALDGRDTQVQAVRRLVKAEFLQIAQDDNRSQFVWQPSQRLA